GRRLVAGARSARPRTQLPRGVGVGDVHLRLRQGRPTWLPRPRVSRARGSGVRWHGRAVRDREAGRSRITRRHLQGRRPGWQSAPRWIVRLLRERAGRRRRLQGSGRVRAGRRRARAMSVLESFSLAGKRALVTGASRGLGAAMAVALAEAGADVACASSTAGGADETACAIRALGRQAWPVHADLADREREASRIDILVNNGGSIARAPAAAYPIDEWDRVLRTNLDSVWLLSQA